jgi:hypothetical protein
VRVRVRVRVREAYHIGYALSKRIFSGGFLNFPTDFIRVRQFEKIAKY